jgi:S-adenosylmethionine/arginine decarboxylase-like enzyme
MIVSNDRLNDAWGYMLCLDLSKCDKWTISNEQHIKNFIDYLVEKIDMVAYGNPMVAHFATHDIDKAGYSFCQMIETSNICGHFVDKNGNAYIDIFSCKPFSNDDVVAAAKLFFKPEKVRVNYLTRNAE